jgi:DNA polymerase elongation subunit (family B)
MNNKPKSLFGKGTTERITGVHLHGGDEVKVYGRTEDGFLYNRKEKFHPFFWVTYQGKKLIESGAPKNMYRMHPLKKYPRSHFDFLVTCPTWYDMKRVLKEAGSEGRENVHYISSAPMQYLMQTGETLFGGMTHHDIKRMQFDIEVYSSTDQFPSSSRKGDEVIIVSIAGSDGYERVIYQGDFAYGNDSFLRVDNERQLITEFVKEVHRFDPDVIEHHNGFSFDLPYMRDRAKMLGVNFAIGRDKRVPKSWTRSKSFAERSIEYDHFEISGRDSIDTMFLAQDFDTYARALDSYRLKYLATFFGVSPEDRTYVEGEDISRVWDEDPERLLDYALDDALETRGVSNALVGAIFELTKSLPMTLQETMETGQSSRIEAMFKREYLRTGTALPNGEPPRSYGGGFTEVFKRGVFSDLVYGDVKSLYPSIMVNYDIQPKSDQLKVFSEAIEYFMYERFRIKDQMKSEEDEREKSRLDAMQAAFKIYINSMYGFLGNQFGMFADFDEAERVTEIGRGILKRIIMLLDKEGCNIVLCDTDGVLFQPPPDMNISNEAFISKISDRLPKGIELEVDFECDKVFSFKAKNYVLVFGDKKKVKGSSLRSRAREPFLLTFMEKLVDCVIEGKFKELRDYYDALRARIISGGLTADEIKQQSNISTTLSEYEQKIESEPDRFYRQASYEVAKRLRDVYNEPVGGDYRVSYFVHPKGRGHGGKVYQKARPMREFDGVYDVEYYLGRLESTAKNFKPMFTDKDYAQLFEANMNPTQNSLFAEPAFEVQVNNSVVNKLPHKANQPDE